MNIWLTLLGKIHWHRLCQHLGKEWDSMSSVVWKPTSAEIPNHIPPMFMFCTYYENISYHESKLCPECHFIHRLSGERQQQGSHWLLVFPTQVHQVWRQPTGPLQPQHHHAAVHQGNAAQYINQYINIWISWGGWSAPAKQSTFSDEMSLCLAGCWQWWPETNPDPACSEGKIQCSEWACHGYEVHTLK